MFSTTRRVVGLVGLTGSLLASSQIPGMVSRDLSKTIVHQTKPFSVSLSTEYGAYSESDVPLPIISTFTPFIIGRKGSRQSLNLPGKAYGKDGREITPALTPGFEIQEDTICPHPLEIADVSVKSAIVVTSPFVLSIVDTQKDDTFEKISQRYKIDLHLLKKINRHKKGLFGEGEKITIFNGNFKKHTVKKGQSIWSIAKKHKIKMSVLIFLNKLKTVKIYPGKELFIPEDITGQSVKFASSVNWVRKLIDPPYQALIARKGRITSPFGWRTHPVTGKRGFHVGLDIAAPKSTTIKAWKDGIVERSCKLGLMGNCVIIRHSNGFSSVYGHCSVLSVKAGDKIKAGQKIAEIGMTGRATGAHVHFAIKKNGHFLNPIKLLGS